MQTILFDFLHDEASATAIERPMIAGKIALVIIAVITALDGAVSGTIAFNSEEHALKETNCAISLTMGDGHACNVIKTVSFAGLNASPSRSWMLSSSYLVKTAHLACPRSRIRA